MKAIEAIKIIDAESDLKKKSALLINLFFQQFKSITTARKPTNIDSWRSIKNEMLGWFKAVRENGHYENWLIPDGGLKIFKDIMIKVGGADILVRL